MASHNNYPFEVNIKFDLAGKFYIFALINVSYQGYGLKFYLNIKNIFQSSLKINLGLFECRKNYRSYKFISFKKFPSNFVKK
eukprot:snap_masked-scaffold_84-processed-gene-0.1-mRNA-1 protein AED:1.00 eAED:1.00 QI:0/0/0/0/1/1/2/0/81